MADKALNRRMSDKHEADLAEWFGGRVTPGSGNQFNRPMDGRQSHLNQSVAFAWDGKSTRGASISVTLPMWAKAIEQSHGERPLLPLRFYGDDRLTIIRADLAVINVHDLLELLG